MARARRTPEPPMEAAEVLAPFLPYMLALAVFSAIARAGGLIAGAVGVLGCLSVAWLLLQQT